MKHEIIEELDKRDHAAENARLVARIKADPHDREARADLALGNEPLLYHMVGLAMRASWTTGAARKQEAEEMVERGWEGMARGIASIERARAPSAYLAACIRHAILKPDDPLIAALPPDIHVYQESETTTQKGENDDEVATNIIDHGRRLDPEWRRMIDPDAWQKAADDRRRTDALLLLWWITMCDPIDSTLLQELQDGATWTQAAERLGLTWYEVRRRILGIRIEFIRLDRRGNALCRVEGEGPARNLIRGANGQSHSANGRGGRHR